MLSSQHSVFRDQFRFSPGKISERAEQKGSRRWFDPTEETFLERVKAETNSLLDDTDQMKRQLNLSFFNRSRTAARQWILNRSDCTFLPCALKRKLVQWGAKRQMQEQMSQVASTACEGTSAKKVHPVGPTKDRWRAPHLSNANLDYRLISLKVARLSTENASTVT
jgi:hypothetical protein